MDGIPALDLWDLVIEVLHSDSNQKRKLKAERGNLSPSETMKKTWQHTEFSTTSWELSHVDIVPWNAKYFHEGAKLYTFEDNEAVIKMIIKGRSPSLRHVSSTHWVALDGLFGRVDLDPMIEIRYVDSKNQLADILTRGHFTRNERNHLLCLFNISLCSAQRCSEFNSPNRSESMSKRQQEGDYDEGVVAKSKPVSNLVSRSCAGPSTTPSSTVSSSPGKVESKDLEMRFETRTGESSSNNQQENLMKRDRVTNSEERHGEARSRATTGSPMTQKPSQTEDLTACTGHPVPTIQSSNAGIGLETKEECDTLSTLLISLKEKWMRGCELCWIVFQPIRWKELARILLFGKYSWHHFCMQQSFLEKLLRESALHTKYRSETNCRKVYDATQTSIRKKELEILSVSEFSWSNSTWEELHLASGKEVIQLMNAEVYVFSDSVLCGKNVRRPAIKHWMGKWIVVVQEFTAIQRLAWTRWRTRGVREENITKTHHTADPPRNPRVDRRTELYTRKLPWKSYIYVDVQRRHLVK